MRTAILIVSLIVANGCAGWDIRHKSKPTDCDTVPQTPTLFQRMGFGTQPPVKAETAVPLGGRSSAETGFVPARSTNTVSSADGATVVLPKLPSSGDES
jgi:hypothetical protein